jgi:hypothetical protein
MRPSTPSNATLRAMAGLGSSGAPGAGAAATPAASQLLPALGGAAGDAATTAPRSRPEGALTPAAASILSTLENMEKVRGRGAAAGAEVQGAVSAWRGQGRAAARARPPSARAHVPRR